MMKAQTSQYKKSKKRLASSLCILVLIWGICIALGFVSVYPTLVSEQYIHSGVK